MNNIYFITDLDRTIIHSKNKGYKCVEMMGDREITYMTEESYEKLQNLLDLDFFKFIPCTMRNIKQTLRVDFIKEYNPEIIICSNGAQIYINGKLDENWDNKMKSLCPIEKLNMNMTYLKKIREEFKGTIEVLEVRNIEDFYITVKCLNSNEADKFYDLIKDSFEEELKVIKIKAKIFVINRNINKLYALDYITSKFNIKNLITAGDSEVDEDFTKRGVSILPSHSSFKHEHSIITKKSNIKSTEDILDTIFNIIENNKNIVIY